MTVLRRALLEAVFERPSIFFSRLFDLAQFRAYTTLRPWMGSLCKRLLCRANTHSSGGEHDQGIRQSLYTVVERGGLAAPHCPALQVDQHSALCETPGHAHVWTLCVFC